MEELKVTGPLTRSRSKKLEEEFKRKLNTFGKHDHEVEELDLDRINVDICK